MTRREIIESEVLPLVKKVRLQNFDPNCFGNCLALQAKLTRQVMDQNKEGCKKYLAFCIQQWPNLAECPLPDLIIREAIDVIGG